MRLYSFIVPTYQARELLRNSLEALNQVRKTPEFDFEVVIVDDGSTDQTEEFIKGINRNYSLKYLYLERTPGSCRSRARNKGIEKAGGSIIIFIDADIIVPPDYLVDLERYYQKDPEILVSGTRLLLQESLTYETVKSGGLFEKYKLNPATGQYQEYRHRVFTDLSYNASAMTNPFLFVHTCNLAVPKTWLEAVGGFDEDLKKWGIEDFEMVYRMFLKGIKIVINCKSDVIHQFHGVVETNVVREHLQKEVEENTVVFLEKHPYAFNIPHSEVHALFKSLASNYVYVEKKIPENINRITIDFKDPGALPEIKETISRFKDADDYLVIVNDYIENTDLDLWIQLQECRDTKVKYYPVSRILSYEALTQFDD